MPKALTETRVRLASGEFVSVLQGEEVPESAPIVREFPSVFGVKPIKPKAVKAAEKGDD